MNNPIQDDKYISIDPKKLKLQFLRYSSAEESKILHSFARRDAWARLASWLVPSALLSIVLGAFWLFRSNITSSIEQNSHLASFQSASLITVWAVVSFLHILLIFYLYLLIQTLERFSSPNRLRLFDTLEKPREAAAVNTPADGAKTEEEGEPQGSRAKSKPSNDAPALYQLSAKPSCQLQLKARSRNGIYFYKWFYYVGMLHFYPLPKHRGMLPLNLQDKQHRNLAQLDKHELARELPDSLWLSLSIHGKAITAELIEVPYRGFVFYYLCALDFPESLQRNQGQKEENQLHKLWPSCGQEELQLL